MSPWAASEQRSSPIRRRRPSSSPSAALATRRSADPVARLRGIRARLAATLVALVALTAILLGAGAYVFVETSLHDQVLRDAAAQARFDLAVTIPNRGLPSQPSADDIVHSGMRQTFPRRRVGTVAG